MFGTDGDSRVSSVGWGYMRCVSPVWNQGSILYIRPAVEYLSSCGCTWLDLPWYVSNRAGRDTHHRKRCCSAMV